VPLLRLSDISIAFGVHHLLEKAEFQLKAGERVGLLGRNGEGKSTLLKIVSGEVKADEGSIWLKPGAKLATLEQAPSLSGDESIYDTVAAGLGDVGNWIAEYHHVAMAQDMDVDKQMAELGRLQHLLDDHDGWKLQQKVEQILTRLELPADKGIAGLSGGWQRRVSLARALVCDPDVLLLDEPTNHLDLESILWLEEHLSTFKGAVLFVTHDRAFLQKLATRIVDLDRGKLISWPGNYTDFLRRKAAALEEEERQNALFDKKLAQEEVWIRQGIKARRTRNEGRVRALEKMRKERGQRREQQSNAKFGLETAERSGKLVIETKGISYGYPEKSIVKDFSTRIIRGDRIGLIGPNGAGKTTLLKLLLGQLEPQKGEVKIGTSLEVAYFDQLRGQLDLNQTVVEAIGDGSDQITINGKSRHVISYLADFLFAPARARSPIKTLSGGERARILLARLFSKSVNLLVMDEPTNDLDIETLELLEELLVGFDGTLLLVSHDRAFMDNVVTSTLVFDSEGVVNEYVGGYSDWLKYKLSNQIEEVKEKKSVKKEKPKSTTQKKLGHKEQRELDKLPNMIEKLEEEQTELNEKISEADFYQQEKEKAELVLNRLEKITAELEQHYTRWDELEAMKDELAS